MKPDFHKLTKQIKKRAENSTATQQYTFFPIRKEVKFSGNVKINKIMEVGPPQILSQQMNEINVANSDIL